MIWLNSAAVDVLASLRQYNTRKASDYAKKEKEWQGGRWVLPGRTNGEPVQWLESTWQRIRKLAGLEDVRIHDLRHTVGAIGAAEGLGLPIIGALLGHTQPATTARYAHVAASPAAAAAEINGQRIVEAMTTKVVQVQPAMNGDKADTAARV